MAEDLQHFHQRVALTREEISELNSLIQEFCARGISSRRVELGGGNFSIRARPTSDLPIKIPRRVGLISNELRSILDNLACTLARRNGKTLRDVYFPISASKQVFESDGLNKIRKLSDDDREKIVAIKPYREENRLLFALHEADRTRKHRHLVGCAGRSLGININGVTIDGVAASVVENCVINGAHIPLIVTGGEDVVLLDDIGTEVEIASGFGVTAPISPIISVAFAGPEELKGAPVVPTLMAFADKVEEIVALFD